MYRNKELYIIMLSMEGKHGIGAGNHADLYWQHTIRHRRTPLSSIPFLLGLFP